MPNALTAGGALPPIPQPQQQQQQQQAPQAAGPQGVPAPTHAQTVAALRHFHAVMGELRGLATNPDLGKANVKSSIIDGTTKLVSQRMMSPGQAVEMLASVPDKPYQQKMWVAQHLQNAMLARAAVLMHHAVAFAGTPPQQAPSADSHQQDLSAMMETHFKRAA
jgi:hypothetical protein